MRSGIKTGNPAVALLTVLAAMYVLTGLLLLLLALVMYRLEPGEAVVRGCMTAIYVLVGFFGGFAEGRAVGRKKYLWGLLAGAMYWVILILVGMMLHQGLTASNIDLLSTLALCTISALAGGMLS